MSNHKSNAKGPRKGRSKAISGLVLIAYPLAAVSIAVAAWAIGVKLFNVPSYLLPSPQAVIISLIDKFGLILSHTPPTAIATISGLGLSIVIGVVYLIAKEHGWI